MKRIDPSIDYIEKQLNIDADVFRTADDDQARKANGIPTRGKDEVDAQVLLANASRITKMSQILCMDIVYTGRRARP